MFEELFKKRITHGRFQKIFDRVISHEGGYVNHPKDPGGETNWGVTKRTARANGYRGSMRRMTRKDAFGIYYRAFWLRYGCDKMDDLLAFQFFDACVNHGFGNAARMLQRALGVADDGIFGKVTMGKLNSSNNIVLAIKFIAERQEFYTRLRTFSTFGKGWIRRNTNNLEYLADDVAELVILLNMQSDLKKAA
ncbi:glycoside hydrolase family 108 protein [Psychrobacter sp. HD31]|uniref:glycoside hydrolase family 108 protein n=1 Tax=Psychrobacter sp. HD31 TaxID=3112003 RepID=UPI003DA5472E